MSDPTATAATSVSDEFDRADGDLGSNEAWTPLPGESGISDAQVDDSAASTVTATVTAVPVDGGILTPWGLLTYPPAARVGDVVRWTIRGGEVTVETYPPDD